MVVADNNFEFVHIADNFCYVMTHVMDLRPLNIFL